MVDWSQSGIQIIASIIGSGLIATALTGLVSEINRPHIDISVQEDLTSPYYYESNFTTTFINTGKTSASNVRLTLNYPEAEINNYTINQESENTSLVLSSKNPHILEAYIPRFSSGAVNRIATTISGDWDAEDLYNTGFDPSSITATYDEGSDIYPPTGYRYAIQVFFIYTVPGGSLPLLLL